MPPSCVNSGNEYVTEGEPKGGGRRRSRALPARARGTRRRIRRLRLSPRRMSDRLTMPAWRVAPLTAASSPAVEPLERRRLVSKALNVDAVLAPYQFDVLMGDAQLLGISQQCDLV